MDGISYPVRRERGDGYAIDGPLPSDTGRAWYSWLDRILIERPDGRLEIRFHLRHTAFEWRGRRLRVRPMLGGQIRVGTEDRLDAEGSVTLSDVRLTCEAPELEDLSRELALGFALRSQVMWVAVIAAGPG